MLISHSRRFPHVEVYVKKRCVSRVRLDAHLSPICRTVTQ